MRSFLLSFFGALAGKITGGILLVVAGALGFGSDKWVGFMIDGLPAWISWFTPDVARVAFLILAAWVFITVFWKPFPFKEWLEREFLEIYELAYLSVGKRPKPKQTMPDDVLHRHRLLKDAINDEKLPARHFNKDGNANAWTQVNRNDFDKYATDSGHKDFMRLAKLWMRES